jgi:hypothetical protein
VLGANALFSNTKGSWNVAIGTSALYTQSFSPGAQWYQTNNVAVGYEALYLNQPTNTSNGANNTALGTFALRANTMGSKNTAIGASADVSDVNLTNATAIGYNAKVGSSYSLVLGGTGADAVKVGIGTSTPQAALDLNGDMILRTTILSVPDSLTTALNVNTSKFACYRISGADTSFSIAGITAGLDGRIITLINGSGFEMTMRHEDANAIMTDRIRTGSQSDLILQDLALVSLQYDTTAQRWLVHSGSQGGETIWDTSGTNIYFENFVGIGTQQPTAPLSIQTILNEPGLSHMAVSGPDSVIMESSITDLGASIGTASNDIFSLTAGGTARLHVWPDGRIVIGEDADPNNFAGELIQSRMTPIEAKLTIESDINSAGWIHIGGPDSIIVSEGIGGVSGAIGTATNHAFRLNSNAVGRLHVYPDGSVVVGRNYEAPVSKFTVYTPNNSHGITHISDAGIILSTNVGGVSAGIGTYSPHIMRIYSNSVAVMNIDPIGNVGIGLFNPLAGYKLSVNGNIKAKELVIETTGWPDYVFGASYKPLPLRELEAFIDQHHHLPNIPSAAELEDNGVPVGEMQKKMMEKIEELTLHILELNRRIESLEKTNRQ